MSPRKDLVVVSGNPTSVINWKYRYFFPRGFIELDNGDPSEFFLPQTWGASGNFLFFMLINLIVSSNLNVLLSFAKRLVNNPFKFVSFFDKVDKPFEVDYTVRTCAELVTTSNFKASSLWKFVCNLSKGILNPLPLNFNCVGITKCFLHNLYGPRHLILGLECTHSKALFAYEMPSKVTVLTGVSSGCTKV